MFDSHGVVEGTSVRAEIGCGVRKISRVRVFMFSNICVTACTFASDRQGSVSAYRGNKNCKTGHAQREDENGANCVKQSAPFVPCMLRDVISSVRHLRNRQT